MLSEPDIRDVFALLPIKEIVALKILIGGEPRMNSVLYIAEINERHTSHRDRSLVGFEDIDMIRFASLEIINEFLAFYQEDKKRHSAEYQNAINTLFLS